MRGMTRASLGLVLRHGGTRTAAAVLGSVLLVPFLASPGQAAPAHGPSSVDITVTSPGGTSATTPADVYTYVTAPGTPLVSTPAPPVMGGVSPSRSPVGGGTLVTLTGSNFGSATGVRFGAVLGKDFTVVNGSAVTAVTPPHSPGPVEVTVLGPGGSSGPATFSYLSASDGPVIGTASPTMGPVAGGTQITIGGSGFDSATTVTIGGVPGTNVHPGPLPRGTAQTLTVTVPAHAAGQAQIVVTNTAGATTAVQRFTYLPPLTAATLTLTIPASQSRTVVPEAVSYAGAGVRSCSSARTTIAAGLGGCVYTAPATAGTDSFTMAVTDLLGQTATQQVNVVITAASTGGGGGTSGSDSGNNSNNGGTGGAGGSGANSSSGTGNSGTGGSGKRENIGGTGGSGGNRSSSASGDAGSNGGSAVSSLGTGGDELNAAHGHPMWLWLALLAAATLCYFVWAYLRRRRDNDDVDGDRLRYEQMMAAGGSPEHLAELSESAAY